MSEERTVYVLTSGEYSNYMIHGVFSTREAAERVMGRMGPDMEVEEYILDDLVRHENGPVWTAAVRLGDGDVPTTKDGAPWYPPDQRPDTQFRHPTRADPVRYVHHWDGGRSVVVSSPISYEHALKVATEKRQEWLRERAAGLEGTS